MGNGIFTACDTVFYVLYLLFSVQRSDYLNTFDFLDKLADNLQKKQSAK